ncbi:MAG: hypothetical protein JXB05_32160 [Myxococcaceae bacterium]|nr:hypothetical protein [Myxococcaceae bacterium]
MRSIPWAVAVVMTSGLLGCGDTQPSIYRVAIDRLTVQNLPGSCYTSGQAPSPIPDTASNVVNQEQWVIWKGLEDAMYLEPGDTSYNLGSAASVNITGDAIQGAKQDDNYEFTTERVRTESANEVYTTSATYTIEDLSDTLKGTLRLNSRCTGTDCGNTPSCEVTLNFAGRKIDADRNIDFGSSSSGG